MPATKIESDAFIRLWYASKTTAEVCERSGLSYAATCAKATRLRKMGVRMPYLDRKVVKLDVDALKALADELAAKGGR